MLRARTRIRFAVQPGYSFIKNKRIRLRARRLVEFLKWAEKDGEQMAKDLEYAPLPENLQQRVLKRIDEIKY